VFLLPPSFAHLPHLEEELKRMINYSTIKTLYPNFGRVILLIFLYATVFPVKALVNFNEENIFGSSSCAVFSVLEKLNVARTVFFPSVRIKEYI
jgi:hypothetical protein